MKHKFKVNQFYILAQQYADEVTSDEDIRKIDMTETFWDEMTKMIQNKEIIINQINAKVRMSKSTTGIHLAQELYHILIKELKLSHMPSFGIHNIARDEEEYAQLMKNPEVQYTFIVTDEINELGKTGINSTVEEAMLRDFSNIHASRYVHRINCSPKGIADPNTDVFLEIIGVDRENMITHTHLYYKMFKGGQEYMQLLGYVNFNLKPLINTWITKVAPHFMKPQRTEEDEKIIQKYRKKDFYTEYMIRKHEKQELLTKERIMRPKVLRYAKVLYEGTEALKPLAKLNIITEGTIMAQVRTKCEEHKIETSIIGEKFMAEEIKSMLILWRDLYKTKNKIKEVQAKVLTGKLTPHEGQQLQTGYEASIHILQEAIEQQNKELEKYIHINERFHGKIERREQHGRNNNNH